MALKSHAKFLCGILGSLKKTDKNEGEDDDEDDDKETEEEIMLQSATSTIDALIFLVRNTRLSGRGDICASTIALLTRISLFSGDASQLPAFTSSTKKKKRKSSSAAASSDWFDIYGEYMINSVRVVETALPYNENIVTVATQRLLTLLADFGLQSIDEMNSCTGKGNKSITVLQESKTTILDVALCCFSYMLESGKLELDRDLGSEEELAPYPLQEDLATIINMRSLLSSSSSSSSSSSLPLSLSLSLL